MQRSGVWRAPPWPPPPPSRPTYLSPEPETPWGASRALAGREPRGWPPQGVSQPPTPTPSRVQGQRGRVGHAWAPWWPMALEPCALPGVGGGGDQSPGAGSLLLSQESQSSGPGVLYCLVFSTSHQSDDSTRVASGMEMFQLRGGTKLKSDGC